MRRRLFGGGNDAHSLPYPSKACHFCTLTSTIVPPHPRSDQDGGLITSQSAASTSTALPLSTGSVDNWFCSQCQCWNRIDAHEEGGMASWEQGMAAALNDVKPARAAAQSRQTSSTHPAFLQRNTNEPVFCHACQTNQMLLLSMSANYDGGAGIDDEAEQWRRYQAWRDDLEARYPPVCADCQETVEGRIRMADQRARALIWNDLLRKRQQERVAQQHASPLRNNVASPAVNSSPATPMSSPRGSLSSLTEQAIIRSYSTSWHAGAACFVLSWLAEALLVDSVNEPTDRRLWFSVALALLHSGTLQWDPSVMRQVTIARRQREVQRVRVTGAAHWRHALYVLACFRLLHVAMRWVLAIGMPDCNRSTAMVMSLSFFALEAGGCMRAYTRVRVETPTRISLKSRTSLQTPLQRRKDGLDLATLTLYQDSSQRVDSHAPREDEEDAYSAAARDDSMDWSPTLSANDGTTSSFQLGPQRFFEPIKQTGLEELLANRLDLGHERAIEPANQSMLRSKPVPTTTTARPMRFAAFALVTLVAASVATAILTSSSSSPTAALSTAFYTLRDRLASPFAAWWHRAQQHNSHDDDGGGLWHAAARTPHRPAAMY